MSIRRLLLLFACVLAADPAGSRRCAPSWSSSSMHAVGVAAMTRNEVVNIFFGRSRQFFNGVEAQPVDMSRYPSRPGAFLQRPDRLKDVSDVNAYWSRQVFSGRAQPPAKVGTPEEVLKWVASHPGGIGFLELSKPMPGPGGPWTVQMTLWGPIEH